MKMLRRQIFGAFLGLTVSATAILAQQTMTRDNGSPVGDNQNSITAGDTGPVLLQDTHLLEKLAAFDRERIPERVVHARGAGAYGTFESYGNFANLTRAAFLDKKGKSTPVFVRFSTVIHSKGSPEIARDPRGFAVKFYTQEGNYDLVGNNLPVFFIRDAIKFPDMVHSLKPSPITNKQEPNRFFDFFSNIPESTQMLTFVYSDMGTPANYRQMDGFGVHSFKWINAKGEAIYVKYKWTSMQGHNNLTADATKKVVAEEWGNATADLYKSVADGKFPAWELSVQVLKPEDLDKFSFNPLDATKTWPEEISPSVKIGKMMLNKMPDNFFEETEQSAFSPANLVPGIEASEDRLLQGRLFSYLDTQRYRLGSNFQKIDINIPKNVVKNYNQDGALRNTDQKSNVNFQPSVTSDLKENAAYRAYQTKISGFVQQAKIKKEDNFAQAGALYLSFTEAERANLISNLAGDLGQVKNKAVQLKMISHFYRANAEYGTRLAKALGVSIDSVTRAAE